MKTKKKKKNKVAQQRARATEEVLCVIGQFLQDDSLEIPNFTDDLVREALWNITQAAQHARELIKRRALGLKLSPLGYYFRDDQIGNHMNIDRCAGGGIDIGPAC